MSLQFQSDLVVSVGEHVGHLTGEGSTLRFTTDDPGAFLTELRVGGATDVRGGVRQAADFLADEGVTVVLTGPQGDVLTAGAAADSAFGRLTTGTRHIAPGAARAVTPLVRGAVRDAARGRRGRVAAASTLAWLVWRGLRRRREP